VPRLLLFQVEADSLPRKRARFKVQIGGGDSTSLPESVAGVEMITTRPDTTGIHHITAISSSPDENVDFYQQVLGLRLVKQTVNFDDPHTYHLYYGDPAGTPGTILTFFPWERRPEGRPGAGVIVSVAFAVPKDALPYWAGRLNATGIDVRRVRRFEEMLLAFNDPHGLPIELIGTETPPSIFNWHASSVEGRYSIRGFHSATALENRLEDTRTLLTQSMGMVWHAREKNRYRFRMDGAPAAGRYLDVVVDRAAPKGRLGTGSVHHIAFRTGTDREQLAWQAHLRQAGINVTEVRDRNYFKSIYFHEPGGILFEIATDSPGFAVDEPLEHLGRSLMLPAQYERIREEIEAGLPPLQIRVYEHAS
jgi:glyoxalase family protein